ncbi:MAG: hypothetical protein IJ561_08065 [Ruminococcus sp.]|nr:hypothetical protein [Ruminococcus sp.]
MKNLIDVYENDLVKLTERSRQLHEELRRGVPEEELASFQARCELLDRERYELMFSMALMKRLTSPKPPSPSLASYDWLEKEDDAPEGDAAC